MTSLAEEYPKQQARCRELLKGYYEIGSVGAFGAAVIEHILREADRAIANQDVVAMLRSFENMKSVK